MKRRWIFLIAFILFAILALIGSEYGAFPLYAIPALLCLVQFFYPTIFLWALFFIVFVSSSAVYTFLLLTDIYKLIAGLSPSALLDFDDSVVFIIFLAILIGVTFILYISRPQLTIIKNTIDQK